MCWSNVGAEYQYIVDIYMAALPRESSKYLVHQPLVGGWRVAESRRHHKELVGFLTCDEGRLLNVGLGDRTLPYPEAASIKEGLDPRVLQQT